MTHREYDKWFRDHIANPAKAAWGRGWERLSEEQKRAELQAAAWRNITIQARLESEDADDMAALGRHVQKLAGAVARYLEKEV